MPFCKAIKIFPIIESQMSIRIFAPWKMKKEQKLRRWENLV
ncbi:MAG: hypothetical protein JWN78_2556 [Bacteroidota bacterium]|nr:hypothetical protein [Bacteroidota bacterium]